MSNPLLRSGALLVFALIPAGRAALADCALSRTEKDAFVLENAFVKLTIDPKVGAKATSFIHKGRGLELAGPYGALADRLWVDGGWGKDFWNKPYTPATHAAYPTCARPWQTPRPQTKMPTR